MSKIVCLENNFLSLFDNSLSLKEGVPVKIPDFTIAGKNVYAVYLTNDADVKSVFSDVAILVNFSGMAAKPNGQFRQVPFQYSTSEYYYYDSSVSGYLANRSMATSGHHLFVVYVSNSDLK